MTRSETCNRTPVAYRHAAASLLAPMIYFQLIRAALLGWQVFNHIPAVTSLVGMA